MSSNISEEAREDLIPLNPLVEKRDMNTKFFLRLTQERTLHASDKL